LASKSKSLKRFQDVPVSLEVVPFSIKGVPFSLSAWDEDLLGGAAEVVARLAHLPLQPFLPPVSL